MTKKILIVTDTYDSDYSRAFTSIKTAAAYIANIAKDRDNGTAITADYIELIMKYRKGTKCVYWFAGDEDMDGLEGIVCLATELDRVKL